MHFSTLSDAPRSAGNLDHQYSSGPWRHRQHRIEPMSDGDGFVRAAVYGLVIFIGILIGCFALLFA